MSLSAAVIRELIGAGLSGDALVAACERIEAASEPKHERARRLNAERQARHRGRNASNVTNVTPSPLDGPPSCPPHPLNHPPLNPPPAVLLSEREPPTRSELDGLESRLRQAANAESSPSPGLFDLSPIVSCLNAGADLESDVLPQIRAITARGHRWRTWGYASQAIMDAKARRESAAPQGEVVPLSRGQPPPNKPTSMNRRVLDALDTMDLSNVFPSHTGTSPQRLSSPVHDVRDG